VHAELSEAGRGRRGSGGSGVQGRLERGARIAPLLRAALFLAARLRATLG
jgi:hypothetical protein